MKVMGLMVGVLVGLGAGVASAQTLPDAPEEQVVAKDTGGAYDYAFWAGWGCGAGASASSVALKPTLQCGVIFGGPLFHLEAGVMGPQANQSAVSGYLSVNSALPLASAKQFGKKHGAPLLVGGYTRMFETGNALDYGLAYELPTDAEHSIQVEVRDYWAFSSPSQHNVVLRVLWLTGLPD